MTGRRSSGFVLSNTRIACCPSFGWARGTITLEPFERPDVLQVLWRRWRIDVLRWRWRIDRLLVHGRASRLDSRLPPAGEEFVVDDAWCQKRRETGCEAEEEIQVGMVPTHVQLPRDSRRQRAAKDRQTLTPQRVSPNWLAPREIAPRRRSLISRRKPRAGLVTSRQTFARRRHLWTPLNPAAPRDDKRTIAMTNAAGRTRARPDERSYGVAEWSE
jgi:hypothetical protein